jgi:hypothetical protein
MSTSVNRSAVPTSSDTDTDTVQSALGQRLGNPRLYEIGDLRRPRLLSKVPQQLADSGLAIFDGVDDPKGLLTAAATVMTVVPHPDAGPEGVTVLSDLGAAGDHPGSAGFSHHALPPHTDRSGVPTPPGLVMLTCAAGVFVGGASLLTDAAAVHADLASTAPDALVALHRARSVVFGGEHGFHGAVFTESQVAGVPVRCRVRLRLDELAAFDRRLEEHVLILRRAIERHTIRLTLAPGRGYVLDNHRWLHARTAYTGARTLLRVLGEPRPELGLCTGIPLTGSMHGRAEINAP